MIQSYVVRADVVIFVYQTPYTCVLALYALVEIAVIT